MPEYAEVGLMTSFANKVLKDRIVVAIHKNPKSKQAIPQIQLPLMASAFHFGKETVISFVSEPFAPDKHQMLRVQYGMSGHWEVYESRFGHKHSLLSLQLHTGHFLEFVDPRRFGRWTVVEGKYTPRTPDLLSKFFWSHLIAAQKARKYQGKRLCEVMMDQDVWSGVGNYLRAEAIFRAGVNPFQRFGDVSWIQLGRVLIELRRTITQAYIMGGGRLQSYVNPDGGTVKASEWLQCYKKKSSWLDAAGRRFWFDSKWVPPSAAAEHKYLGKEDLIDAKQATQQVSQA